MNRPTVCVFASILVLATVACRLAPSPANPATTSLHAPPVAVSLTLTPRAAAHLKFDGHPICLSLIVTGASRSGDPGPDIGTEQVRCLSGPGVAAFAPTVYSEEGLKRLIGPPQLDIQGSSFNRQTFRNDYDCDVIDLTFERIHEQPAPMRCDLIDQAPSR